LRQFSANKLLACLLKTYVHVIIFFVFQKQPSEPKTPIISSPIIFRKNYFKIRSIGYLCTLCIEDCQLFQLQLKGTTAIGRTLFGQTTFGRTMFGQKTPKQRLVEMFFPEPSLVEQRLVE
jgi:hypothetical protein